MFLFVRMCRVTREAINERQSMKSYPRSTKLPYLEAWIAMNECFHMGIGIRTQTRALQVVLQITYFSRVAWGNAIACQHGGGPPNAGQSLGHHQETNQTPQTSCRGIKTIPNRSICNDSRLSFFASVKDNRSGTPTPGGICNKAI